MDVLSANSRTAAPIGSHRHSLSVVVPLYNEEAVLSDFHRRLAAVLDAIDADTEIIYVNDGSRDRTMALLTEMHDRDARVTVIELSRNFGKEVAMSAGLDAARGDAVVVIDADLQDPPELIPEFLGAWERGFKVAVGVKASGEESWPMSWIRDGYYRLLARLSDVEPIRNSTGFGLCDREVVEIIRQMNDPYPYFRGLLPEIGFPIARIEYVKPLRKRGKTKNNFYTLFDLAMLGITTHSKMPLRLATIGGFALSALSLGVALAYLVAKLIFWYRFPAGIAPILIGLFVGFSIQLFFLGLLGEYVSAVHTQTLRRPLVVERERINFEETPIAAPEAGGRGSRVDREEGMMS